MGVNNRFESQSKYNFVNKYLLWRVIDHVHWGLRRSFWVGESQHKNAKRIDSPHYDDFIPPKWISYEDEQPYRLSHPQSMRKSTQVELFKKCQKHFNWFDLEVICGIGFVQYNAHPLCWFRISLILIHYPSLPQYTRISKPNFGDKRKHVLHCSLEFLEFYGNSTVWTSLPRCLPPP